MQKNQTLMENLKQRMQFCKNFMKMWAGKTPWSSSKDEILHIRHLCFCITIVGSLKHAYGLAVIFLITLVTQLILCKSLLSVIVVNLQLLLVYMSIVVMVIFLIGLVFNRDANETRLVLE